ncbi:MAG: hypothetical protein AAGA85_23555 [Bacteroidota bacterium]
MQNPFRHFFQGLCFSSFLLFTVISGYAQHRRYQDHHVNIHDKHESEHHIEFFVNFYEHAGDVLELDYEYIFGEMDRRLGLALTVDWNRGEELWLFSLPLYVHPYRGLKFFAGPGWVLQKGGEAESPQNVALRYGTAYDFHYSRVTVTPTCNFVILDNQITTELGIAIGFIY